jgi:Meckel syndrome type 1 protein
MRINQILTESEQQQLQDLYEGPKFNKFGKAVGDIAGMAAKGVGAVAGGIAGAGSAIKKGFQAGKDRVAQGGDSPDAVIDPQKRTRAKAAPAGGTTAPQPTGDPTGTNTADPATTGKKPGFIAGLKAGLAGKPTPTGNGGAAAGGTAPAPADNAADANAQGPKGTAPAKPQTGAAAAAMKKTADATAGVGAEKAGQTLYAQVKSQVNQLDKKGKQRIMQLLTKSMAAPQPKSAADPAAAAAKRAAARASPAAADPAATGAAPAGGAAEPNTMANAPVSKTNKAKPGNPNAAPEPGMTADGQPHYDPATGKGAKFDGVTGEMTPAWKAEQDKQAAAKQTKAAPAQQDKAPAPAPAAPTTGQAATQAADAGGNPEQAALDAMKAKNPKLAGMMAQAGMDDQGNDVEPVKKKGGKKKPAAPSQATMDADRERNMGNFSDSKIRTGNALAETLMRAIAEEKRRMVAEGKISIFRKH